MQRARSRTSPPIFSDSLLIRFGWSANGLEKKPTVSKGDPVVIKFDRPIYIYPLQISLLK